MNKLRRIAAWICILVIAVLLVTTLVLGFFGSPETKNLFIASLVCLIVFPCILYAMMLAARILSGRGAKPADEQRDSDSRCE